MTIYQGIYETDFQVKFWSNLETNVFTQEGDEFLTTPSTPEFDDPILPVVFKNKTRIPTEVQEKLSCPTSIRLRIAKLYLSNTQYVSVTLPFAGGTVEFSDFFEGAAILEPVIELDYVGERVSPRELKFICLNL